MALMNKKFEYATIFPGIGSIATPFSDRGGVEVFSVDDAADESTKRFYKSISGAPQNKLIHDSFRRRGGASRVRRFGS